MELGKKIRQLRLKAKLTQEQLAQQLGLGAQSVSKWENGAAMPDITLLPRLAEIFGVSIDDLFDLTAEQRLNRVENRLDTEEELPRELFWEYEDFLKGQLEAGAHRERATVLMAYLYWHRMRMYAKKTSRYAREAVRMAPGKKDCTWMLNMAEGHAVWDWNLANHRQAIDFYREVARANPACPLPWELLTDNLIADHRTAEAEKVLAHLQTLPGVNPILCETYRAHIALARFREEEADRIIEELVQAHPDDRVCLFEAAQYYAKKCSFDRAIALYERSFEKEARRPRFQDELQGILDIHILRGEYRKAAETCDRILALLRDEWGITEGDDLKNLREKKAELLARA
jgi:transcriptional regulator with XRE-family HTH domain